MAHQPHRAAILAAVVNTELMDADLQHVDPGRDGSLDVAHLRYPDPTLPAAGPIPRPLADTVTDVFALAPLPAAVVLSCGGGGHIMAAEGLLDVRAGVDEDWRAVECSRSNVNSNVRLVHTDLGGNRCEQITRDSNPEVVLANIGKGASEGSVGAVLRTFAASSANLLVLECSAHLLTSSKWRELLPSLEKSYAMGAAELSALSVNVPTAKKRTFVTIVRQSKFPYVTNKLLAWKAFVERASQDKPTLGNLLKKQGTCFLSRKCSERRVFSFEEPCISIAKSHIMGIKPASDEFVAHKADAGPAEEAQELSLSDFKQILTQNRDYEIPPTVTRGTAANILATFALPAMMREILVGLRMQGFFRDQDDMSNIFADELAMFENPLAKSKFQVTPAKTRSATRREQRAVNQRDGDSVDGNGTGRATQRPPATPVVSQSPCDSRPDTRPASPTHTSHTRSRQTSTLRTASPAPRPCVPRNIASSRSEPRRSSSVEPEASTTGRQREPVPEAQGKDRPT